MNKTVHLFLALATFASLNAWAAPGTQFGATSDYKNPKDLKGLCTPAAGNNQEFYYKFGLCESLSQFFRKPCMQDLLEQMRKSMVKPEDGKEAFSLGLSCDSKSSSSGQSGSIDGKNKVAFDNFLMQFIAASVIQESNWDTLNGLQNTANANHDGKTGGLLNLTNRKIFDDPANACGCRTINSNGQAGNGKSPGDKDGFQSLNCGAYVALKQAQKDGTLFGGMKSKSNQTSGPAPASTGSSPDDADKPKGAAVYFTSLQEENTARPPSTDPNDPGYNNPKLNNLVYKLKTYCQSALSNSGSFMDGAWDATCPKDLGGYCSQAPGGNTAQ